MKQEIILCTCDACRYTFSPALYPNKSPIPKRCPDCGKMEVDGRSAVRYATEKEIEDYWRIQTELIEELDLVPE